MSGSESKWKRWSDRFKHRLKNFTWTPEDSDQADVTERPEKKETQIVTKAESLRSKIKVDDMFK